MLKFVSMMLVYFLVHCVDVVYLDFPKAFDLGSHDVLVGKLRCLGMIARMLE